MTAAPTVPAVALHKLPVQLRMLVRLMGEAAAYRLVQWRGGTPWTVPKSVRSPQFTKLAEMVGAEPGAALVAEMTGQTLQLPKYDGVLRQLRHQRVVELRSKGVKLHEVALATGYTVRQVINILNRAGLPSLCDGLDGLVGQGDLFGPDADELDDATEAPAVVAETGPTAHNPFGLAQRPVGPKAAKASQPV